METKSPGTQPDNQPPADPSGCMQLIVAIIAIATICYGVYAITSF